MSDDALGALTTLWERHGLSPSDLDPRDDGTLVASARTQLSRSDTLLASRASGAAAMILSPEPLELGELLGRGGMGEVRLARQASLGRDVAVKTVRAEGDAHATYALLKEAWVGAALEHPNVVPVHTLARSGDGAAVVMKRVEGVSWTEVLEDPSAHERFRGDPLEPQLRVLIAVCRAVELAHSRGILHLDLKPDNVMIGAYGEVYVVDWGLASAYGESGPPWLANARQIASVAGTPAYMAPELAAADGERVGPATDVYLLGGMLHTILTGEPLHAGESVMSLLLAAFLSAPKDYGPEVPGELAGIAARATAKDPNARFASAEAFREAIEDFLRHRRADRLAGRAAAVLEEVSPLLDRGAGDVDVEPRLAECELALEQARRGWPEHPRLAPLGEDLLESRVRHALGQERPSAASAFLVQMRAPDPSLTEALAILEARVRERETRVERLEEMSRQLDLTFGGRARRRVFAGLGFCWLIGNLLFGQIIRRGLFPIGYRELMIEGGLLVAVLVPYAWLNRGELFQNRANQRLYGGLTSTAVAVELHWTVCLLLDLPVAAAVAITPLYYVYAFASLAMVLDRRLWPATGILVVCAIAAPLWPEGAFDLIGIGGAGAVASTLWAWRDAR